MRLKHLCFPRLTHYATAAALQESLVARFLAAKASQSTVSPPDPHVITAEFHPVYTCGRREIGTVSAEQQEYLRLGGRAEFVEAQRGGQTTFHGPGQLIAYPIIDLRRHKLTPRSYVCLLEKTLIAACAAHGVKAFTTEHTGVWTSPDDKIAAIGVHMRRNITSHGIGLNVNTDLTWFSRIVACGLEGKRTTTINQETGGNWEVEMTRKVFVDELGQRLGIEGVDEQCVVEVEPGEYRLGDGEVAQ